MSTGKIIGIDLGTTNSVVAIMEGGQTKVLINASGNRTTPSVVGFTENGERLVGQPARHQQVTNPKNTVFSIKRFMGRRAGEVQDEQKTVPYAVLGGSGDLVKVDIRGKQYTPPEISAMVLQELKKIAEDYLGEKVERAVITVPAYFNDSQRQATKDAGEIAGLKVERIINEPTAAALAYGLEKKKNARIAVLHFGGGTFDISVLDVGDGVFEVLASNGDGHLGGDDFDQRLIDFIAEDFRKKEGIDVRKDPMALQRLKEAAEKAKIELSSAMETSVNLPFITADQNGPKHLQCTVTRATFESLCADLFDRLRTPCEQCLKDAKLSAGDIQEVVMVGGSIRIPRVQQVAKEIFRTDKLDLSINPDEVVAIGAAIQGGVLQGEVKDVLLLDVTPLSLGVETLGGVMTTLIARNTTIPTAKKEVFSTDPGTIAGRAVLIVDDTPGKRAGGESDSQHSVADGDAENAHPSRAPRRSEKIHPLPPHSCVTVTVHVAEGERHYVQDNTSMARLELTGIAAAPRGTNQIEVEFNIDANGILNVKATDKSTGKAQEIKITGSSGLTKDEVERMAKEAETHAAEDKARRELVDLKNQAEQVCYATENLLAVLGAKVSAKTWSSVESAVSNLRRLVKGGDRTAIEAAMKQLNNASMDLGSVVYESTKDQPRRVR